MSFGGQRKAGLDQPPLQRDSSFPRLAVTIQGSFPYVLSIVPFKFIYSTTLPHTPSPSHCPVVPGFSLRSGCGTLTAAANHAERALGCVCGHAGMVPHCLLFPYMPVYFQMMCCFCAQHRYTHPYAHASVFSVYFF